MSIQKRKNLIYLNDQSEKEKKFEGLIWTYSNHQTFQKKCYNFKLSKYKRHVRKSIERIIRNILLGGFLSLSHLKSHVSSNDPGHSQLRQIVRWNNSSRVNTKPGNLVLNVQRRKQAFSNQAFLLILAQDKLNLRRSNQHFTSITDSQVVRKGHIPLFPSS